MKFISAVASPRVRQAISLNSLNSHVHVKNRISHVLTQIAMPAECKGPKKHHLQASKDRYPASVAKGEETYEIIWYGDFQKLENDDAWVLLHTDASCEEILEEPEAKKAKKARVPVRELGRKRKFLREVLSMRHTAASKSGLATCKAAAE